MRKLMLASLAVLMSFGCSTGEGEGDITVPEAPSDAASTSDSPDAGDGVNDHGTKTFTANEFDVEMELDDNYFSPTNIKSPGDATAMIELHNKGSATHTFTVPGLDVDEELAPDEKKDVEVKIGAERYEFYCRFHKDSGMRGSFQPH